MTRKPCPTPQRGAALLLALLSVTLMATLASASLWQIWRITSVESAERAGQQVHWLLLGAHDWARVVMREDALGGQTDHLGEPWAVPLQEASLSDFLAAAPGNERQASTPLAEQVFLSGEIQDMQARLNVRNLVVNGTLDETELRLWRRLYQQLALPVSDLAPWTQAYLRALTAPPTQDAPLVPQRVSQLTWLGMPVAHLTRLTPYITLLPSPTPVNLYTAGTPVLTAVVPGLGTAGTNRWETARQQGAWRTLADATPPLGNLAAPLNPLRHSLQSSFFEVNARLRMNDIALRETALIRRDGLQTHTVWLERRPWPAPNACAAHEGATC